MRTNCLPARTWLSSLALLSIATAAGAQEPCFSSEGGPFNAFDWVVQTGEVFIFDTTETLVVGGPNGVPLYEQLAVGGRIEVRRLVVEEGGVLRVQGPNPMRIQASSDVVIHGRIDLSGFNARDVATLNTGNQTERGAVGGPGGGRGGDANVNTAMPSPRGEAGQGPFGAVDAGGQGGESGHAPAALGKDARRPGGGGGGRFAADSNGGAAMGFSLAASAGTDGHPWSTGAESGLSPARGGAAGAGPFVDGNPRNDFFGVRPLAGAGGRILGLIRGELTRPWSGSGGGGGGNAMTAFPNPNWNFSSDEKGGPGGGGGGTLHVQALGRIVFGLAGEIRSDGGLGGTGENTYFLDHVGGTGGAGSGGHVVLESAEWIDFTDEGLNLLAGPRDWITAYGRPRKTGRLVDVDPCCRGYSNGGASSGGVIQLHVPDPATAPAIHPGQSDVVVPLTVVDQRSPLDGASSPAAQVLFLTCKPVPFAPEPFSWVDLGGRATRRSYARLALEELGLRDLAEELIELELPRRF